MEINIQLDDGAYMPDRAYTADAGADLRAPHRFMLRGNSFKTVDTGVHIEIPEGYVGLIKSRSGLMCHEGIITDGKVDAGYSGSISVTLFNHTGRHREFLKGEKIAQLVIVPVETPTFNQVDKVKHGERGNNGYGSTGA